MTDTDTLTLDEETASDDLGLTEEAQPVVLTADQERLALNLEQRENLLKQNEELVDAAVDLWQSFEADPTQAVMDLIEAGRDKGLNVDLNRIAPRQQADTSEDDYTGYGETEEMANTTDIEAANRIAEINKELKQLQRHVGEQTAQTAQEKGRQEIAELQKSIPAGKAITFEDAQAYASKHGMKDVAAAWKAQVVDRQIEATKTKATTPKSAPTQTGGTSGMSDGSRKPNEDNINTRNVADAKSWNPMVRFGQTQNDIVNEALAKLQVSA